MKLTEKTIETKDIYKGKIINLRVDSVELPDGKIASREVVEHKGAVAIVPVLEKNKVVLVKQYRHPAGKVLLEIPAGTLNPSEDPLDCAKRELIEETGYSAAKWTKLFGAYLAPGYSNEFIHIYLAEDLTPAHAEADEDEFIEVSIVGIDEAIDMISTGEIEDAKTISGLLMAQQFVSNGREKQC